MEQLKHRCIKLHKFLFKRNLMHIPVNLNAILLNTSNEQETITRRDDWHFILCKLIKCGRIFDTADKTNFPNGNGCKLQMIQYVVKVIFHIWQIKWNLIASVWLIPFHFPEMKMVSGMKWNCVHEIKPKRDKPNKSLIEEILKQLLNCFDTEVQTKFFLYSAKNVTVHTGLCMYALCHLTIWQQFHPVTLLLLSN